MSNTNQISKLTIKSGLWKSSSNNLFWIQVQGSLVYWLGMNRKTEQYSEGANWCHVGHGTIQNDIIVLHWSDIPIGNDNLSGHVTIQIINECEMKVIKDSGSFGLSQWKWVCDKSHFLLASSLTQ